MQLAQFSGAHSFCPSPDRRLPLPMAEFQPTINKSKPLDNSSGIYEPATAFCSADQSGYVDPPISSGRFTRNPDGSTTIVPVFAPYGDPAKERPLPVPAGLVMGTTATIAIYLLVRTSRRRKS